jgi:hypothetical protein
MLGALPFGMNLSLKIISAVGHATAPYLSYEINGALGLLSVIIRHLAPSQLRKNGNTKRLNP